LPDSRRASAPATDAAAVDRRFTGAVLARRPTRAFFFVCSDMMGSGGEAPAASSHLTRVRIGCGVLIWPDLALICAWVLGGDSAQPRSFPGSSHPVGARSGAQ